MLVLIDMEDTTMQLPDVFRNEPLTDVVRRLWDPFFYNVDYQGDDQRTFVPSSDIVEDDKQWSLLIDLPGVEQKDLSVDLEGRWLTIKAKRQTKKEVNEGRYRHIERVSGNYQRRFTLPENVDSEQLTAKMKDGVLHIVIGKKEIEKTHRKQIPIQVD